MVELLVITESSSIGFKGESHKCTKPLGATTQNPHLGKSHHCFEIIREAKEVLEKR